MNNINANNTRNVRIFLGVVLAVISVVDSWSACTYISSGYKPLTSTKWCKASSSVGYDLPVCNTLPSCQGVVIQGQGPNSSNYYYDCWINYSGRSVCNDVPSWGTVTVQVNETTCNYQCTSLNSADSLKCELDGNIWQGGTCKVNHCTASDSTWLSTSIAACTGSNNYAIVSTDSTCEHVGTCCPNDSIPSGNTCKWRCDSVLTTCGNRTGELFGGVLPDTSVSGQDTTFSYQCYYNCSHSPNPDSTVYLVEGNIVLSGPSDSIPDGIKSETFNSVRTTTGGVYIYDYLSPSASEYIDSIAAMKCVEHLWRCVINNKYVYWYDNQEVPAGCTNIVRVK